MRKESGQIQRFSCAGGGFSAYFVELHIDGQNDLIRRTELAL